MADDPMRALRTVLEKASLTNTAVDEIVLSLAPVIGAVEADLMLALIVTQADVWLRQRKRGR